MTFGSHAHTAVRCLLIGALLSGLAACATPSQPEQMVPLQSNLTMINPGEPAYQQLRVGTVDGGSATNPLWTSEVSNADFKTALSTALKNVHYASDDPAKANVEISANLVKFQRPMFGLDMTVTSTVRYSAKSTADGSLVFDDTVAASGTATMGEALMGVERLKKANEASIRANIQEFLRRFKARLTN
jgi:hypothetical protein